MIIVGIDPGAHGAVSVLNTYSFNTVLSIPFAGNTISDIYLYLSEVRGGEPSRRAELVAPLSNLRIVNTPTVVRKEEGNRRDNSMEIWLENPGPIRVPIAKRSGNKNDKSKELISGLMASISLGRSVGLWEGIGTALSVPINLVAPKKWQSVLGCPTRGDKNISKKAAISAFPFLTDRNQKSIITHDIADSLLIALYGYLQYQPVKYIPYSVKSLLSSLNKGRKNDRNSSSRTDSVKTPIRKFPINAKLSTNVSPPRNYNPYSRRRKKSNE